MNEVAKWLKRREMEFVSGSRFQKTRRFRGTRLLSSVSNLRERLHGFTYPCHDHWFSQSALQSQRKHHQDYPRTLPKNAVKRLSRTNRNRGGRMDALVSQRSDLYSSILIIQFITVLLRSLINVLSLSTVGGLLLGVQHHEVHFLIYQLPRNSYQKTPKKRGPFVHQYEFIRASTVARQREETSQDQVKREPSEGKHLIQIPISHS
jgi:hypothetical protein